MLDTKRDNEIIDSCFLGLRLFGETYSGLEYDYRGLCHVYESLNDTEKYLEYALILDTWKQLKEDQNRVNVSICVYVTCFNVLAKKKNCKSILTINTVYGVDVMKILQKWSENFFVPTSHYFQLMVLIFNISQL